ncbi:Uncharacterised protein [Mycobacteroides abscessus]|nr:Uncharacterised protein [Mycobacteroides abscessus]SKV04269.1 Uncharacterised protein [Mycobacteroides abscessus subsp. abscessus]
MISVLPRKAITPRAALSWIPTSMNTMITVKIDR